MNKPKKLISILLSLCLLLSSFLIIPVSVSAVGANDTVQIDQSQICIQGYDTTMSVEEFRNNGLLAWNSTYYEGTLASPFKQPDYHQYDLRTGKRFNIESAR